MPSQTQTQTPVAATSIPVAEPVKVPFNPFVKLDSDQVAALITRLNPTWKTDNDGDIRIAATEYGCDHAEASMYVWLRSLAVDQIETQAYNRIFSSAKAMLEQVGAGSLATLAIMAEDYSKLPTSMVRKYRINLRDAIMSKWSGETAVRVLGKIMEKTAVSPEKEWMR